ncbi:annulin-like [Cimex lectularius]|uniref:Transglutaminase N-terminal domain-containing protein n=1 Tax=Cimex lectularius TaxID=79782 RepID=A0A8I6TDV9_CIMLE|nr:annulin-like [Cimex lectularius]
MSSQSSQTSISETSNISIESAKGENEIIIPYLVTKRLGENFKMMTNVPGALMAENYESQNMNQQIPSITKVDLNFQLNGFYHKSNMYEVMKRNKNPQLVIRRGQPFRVTVTLNRPIGLDERIKLLIYAKDLDSASVEDNTHFTITPKKTQTAHLDKGKWVAVWDFISQDEKTLYILVMSSHDSAIGKWNMEIWLDNGIQSSTPWKMEDPIFLIFNAWNKNDEAFVPDPKSRFEYIIKDVGVIFRGIHNSITKVFWKYSQYEEQVLEFAVDLVQNIGKLPLAECGSLALVMKKIAESIIHPPGIVEEMKAENYSTDMTIWTGTNTLLHRFSVLKTPIKYVHHHVISALIVSCLRTLGVGCRNVTCYNWAINPIEPIYTVDLLYTSNEMSDVFARKMNSIACYFVYTEVWARGICANKEVTGWYGLTPDQGPFPMRLIKKISMEKEIQNKSFYGNFNSDCIIWKFFRHNLPIKLVTVDVKSIGSLVATKAENSWRLSNITSYYKKQKVQTTEEKIKEVVLFTREEPLFQRFYVNNENYDLSFDLSVNQTFKINETIRVTFGVNNVSNIANYSVEIRVIVASVLCTGQFVDCVKDDRKFIYLEPKSSRHHTFMVPTTEYIPKLSNECIFKVMMQAYVKENTYDYYECVFIRAILPELMVSIEPFAKVNCKTIVELSFTNSTLETIEEAVLSLAELDSLNVKIFRKFKIMPQSSVQVQFAMVPRQIGTYHMAAKLLTDHWNVVNYVRIPVKPHNPGNALL